MNWKEEIAFNEKILDGLDLPEPENYEDLIDYINQNYPQN